MTTQPAMLKTLTGRIVDFGNQRELQPIEGKSVRGYWIEGGGGMVAVDRVILAVRVGFVSNTPATDKLAREMLAAARIDTSPQAMAAAVAPAIDPAQRRLESFDGTWALVFEAPGLPTVHDVTFRRRKIREFWAADWKRGFDVLVRFEPAANPEAGDDPAAARKYYESQQQRQEETRPRELEDGQRARVEKIAIFRRSNGGARRSRDLYFARGGIWANIYVSCPAGDRETVKAMNDLLASFHIETHSPAATKPATSPTH